MKSGMKLILKYIVMYLSCLWPRSRKVWVFGAWLGQQFADNPKYLFIEANQMEGIRPVWITKNPQVVREVRALGCEAYLFSDRKGILCQLRAKYAVMCNGISDLNHAFLGRAVFLNVWHGVPLKKVGYDDTKEKDWDSRGQRIRRKIQQFPLGREYVVATSRTFSEIYKSAFRRPAEQILTYGQPRNDFFYDDEELFPVNEKLRKRLEGQNVVLYAPTHRQEGKTPFPLKEHFDLKGLDEFCRDHQILFIIRRHFYHIHEDVDLSDYSNIVDMTKDSLDIQELLIETDILITDYSSTYIDYLLLDRPVIFYDFDYDSYIEKDREMYFPYDEVTPGIKAGTFDELMNGMSQIVSGIDDFKEDRKKVRDLFYCKRGQREVGRALLEKMQLL